jgi:DNA-binding NarL/FixJ family response regulator
VRSRAVLLVRPASRAWPELCADLSALPNVYVLGEVDSVCQAQRIVDAVRADVILTVTPPASLAEAHDRSTCTCRPAPSLTAREQRVLRRLAQGFTHHHIATVEHLALRTVERTITQLATKLQAPTRLALVARAALLGLITESDLSDAVSDDGGNSPSRWRVRATSHYLP